MVTIFIFDGVILQTSQWLSLKEKQRKTGIKVGPVRHVPKWPLIHTTKGPFIILWGKGEGGLVGFGNRITHARSAHQFFFHITNLARKKNLNEQYLDFHFFNILYYHANSRYCAHYNDNIYNHYSDGF